MIGDWKTAIPYAPGKGAAKAKAEPAKPDWKNVIPYKGEIDRAKAAQGVGEAPTATAKASAPVAGSAGRPVVDPGAYDPEGLPPNPAYRDPQLDLSGVGQGVSRLWDQLHSDPGQVFADAAQEVARTPADLTSKTAGAARIVNDYAVGKIGQAIGVPVPPGTGPVSGALRTLEEGYRQPEPTTPGGQLGRTAGTLGLMVGAPALAGAGRVAALSTAAGIGAVDQGVANYYAAGGDNGGDKAFAAFLNGLGIGGAGAVVPLDRLNKATGGGFGKALADVAIFGGAAGTQTALNEAMMQGITGEDLPILKDAVDAGIFGALTGAVATAVAHVAVERAPQREQTSPGKVKLNDSFKVAEPESAAVDFNRGDDTPPEATFPKGQAESRGEDMPPDAVFPKADQEAALHERIAARVKKPVVESPQDTTPVVESAPTVAETRTPAPKALPKGGAEKQPHELSRGEFEFEYHRESKTQKYPVRDKPIGRKILDPLFHESSHFRNTIDWTVQDINQAIRDLKGVRQNKNTRAAIEYLEKIAPSSETMRRTIVERALSQGKNVPPEVLADYPDLAQPAPAPASEAPTVRDGGAAQRATIDADFTKKQIPTYIRKLRAATKKDARGRYVGSVGEIESLEKGILYRLTELHAQGDLDADTLSKVKKSGLFSDESLSKFSEPKTEPISKTETDSTSEQDLNKAVTLLYHTANSVYDDVGRKWINSDRDKIVQAIADLESKGADISYRAPENREQAEQWTISLEKAVDGGGRYLLSREASGRTVWHKLQPKPEPITKAPLLEPPASKGKGAKVEQPEPVAPEKVADKGAKERPVPKGFKWVLDYDAHTDRPNRIAEKDGLYYIVREGKEPESWPVAGAKGSKEKLRRLVRDFYGDESGRVVMSEKAAKVADEMRAEMKAEHAKKAADESDRLERVRVENEQRQKLIEDFGDVNGWKRDEIGINTRDDVPLVAKGYTDKTGNFFVWKPEGSDTWSLTHKHTGLRIEGGSQADLKSLANRLVASGMDWSFKSTDGFKDRPGYKESVDIIEAFKRGGPFQPIPPKIAALDAKIDAKLKDIAKKSRGKARSNLPDPELLKDVTELAGLYVKKAGYTIEKFVQELVDRYGEPIRAYAEEAWRSHMPEDAAKVEDVAPEPKAAKTEPEPEKSTGPKNRTVDAELEAMGFPPAKHGESITTQELWDQTLARVAKEPKAGKHLVDELTESPRTLSKEDVALLAHELNERINERDAAEAALAADLHDPALKARRKAAIEAYAKVAEIDTLGGTEQGQALSFRKMMIKRDFSLAAIERDWTIAKGAPLNEAETAQASRVASEMSEKLKADAEEAAATKYSDRIKALEETVAALKRKGVRERPPRRGAALEKFLTEKADAARARLKAKMFQANAGFDVSMIADAAIIGAEKITKGALDIAQFTEAMVAELGDEIRPHIEAIYDAAQRENADASFGLLAQKFAEKPDGGSARKMAEILVANGMEEPQRIVDTVYEHLVKEVPDITRDQVHDAISGYGEYHQLSQHELAVKMRDLRGQLRELAKLRDLEKGLEPLKTGFEQRERSKKERDIQKEVDALKKKLGFGRVADATKQRAFETRTENEIAKIKKQIEERDFGPHPRRQPPPLTEKGTTLKVEIERLRRERATKKAEFERENWSKTRKAIEVALQIKNAHSSIKSAFDLSAIMRQAGKATAAHPVRAAMFMRQMLRATRSEAYAERLEAKMKADPRFDMAMKARLELTELDGTIGRQEEAIRSSWAEKIPGIKASNRAFITFLNHMRFEGFKALVDSAPETVTPDQAEVLAHAVNVMTGRGNIKGWEADIRHAANVLWAPKLLLSQIQFMSGQPLWKGDRMTRRLILNEYVRAAAGLGVLYGLGSLLSDKHEDDPRSSDFGKLVRGNTRIDLWGGMQQPLVLGSRMASGETKNIAGKVTPIRGEVPYGKKNAYEIGMDFVRTKFTPILGLTADVLSGESVVGEKVTPKYAAKNLLVPLPFDTLYEALKDRGVPEGSALWILAQLGIGVSTFEKEKQR